MKKRSKRQEKKIHTHWLPMIMIDISQHSYWLNLLVNSSPHEEFLINKDHITYFARLESDAIKKYNLRYVVSKVGSEEADPWLSSEGAVIFKFWPEEFPAVKTFSGNTPDYI